MRLSPISADALPPGGPVSSRAKRIIEFFCIEKKDLVVDLYCRDLQSPQGLAFLVLTSGVRIVQMGTLTFGRFPVCYEKVLFRSGFSLFKGNLRHLLAAVFNQLDPAARFLIVVDSAPASDALLFAEELRHWKRQPRSPWVIAELMRDAGFFSLVEAGGVSAQRSAMRGRVSGTGSSSTPPPKRGWSTSLFRARYGSEWKG